MNEDTRKRVFALLPEKYRGKAYIAGGALISDTPRDIDLWVLEPGLPTESEKVFAHPTIRELCTHFNVRPEQNYGYSLGNRRVGKLATLNLPRQGLEQAPPVQLMVVPNATVSELLEEFDINVHAIAVDAEGATIYGKYWVDPRLPINQPRPQQWDSPSSTLRRLFSLCERYGVPVNWDDVTMLALMHLRQVRKRLKEGKEVTFLFQGLINPPIAYDEAVDPEELFNR